MMIQGCPSAGAYERALAMYCVVTKDVPATTNRKPAAPLMICANEKPPPP
jgi:hypothetical protein